MRRSVAAALLAIAWCGSSGLAHAADDCRNGSFPLQDTTFRLAKVVGAPRTYLRSDVPPCPDETTACRGYSWEKRPRYLVPGDTVIAGAASGPYVCVLYVFPNRDDSTAGYVRREEIAPRPVAAPVRQAAWIGRWHDGDDSITLRANGPKLTATGAAYWPSAHPSPEERPYGPNLGEMGGVAAPEGNVVVFGGKDADDCRVMLTLLPPFLLAADNRRCGGANVSFTGVYRRGRMARPVRETR